MAMGVEMVYIKSAVSWQFGAGSGDGPLAMDAGRDSCTGSAQMQCDGTGSGEGPGTVLEAARTCRNLQCDDTGSGESPGKALEAARTCRIQWEMSQGVRECLVSTGSCRRGGRASALQDLIVFEAIILNCVAVKKWECWKLESLSRRHTLFMNADCFFVQVDEWANRSLFRLAHCSLDYKVGRFFYN